MSHSHLSSYLNDHLAGAIAGLELLENIASCYSGTDIEERARRLHADVFADREQLEALMAQLGVSQSVPKKVSTWMAQKMVELKLRLGDPATGTFRLLESAEFVSIGVEGKRLLWRSLSTAAEQEPQLKALDYENLIARAEEQRRELEAIRLEAARSAFSVKT